MKKGQIIAIPRTDEVRYYERIGQVVEQYENEPDGIREQIVEEKSIKLIKCQFRQQVSSDMTLIPNYGIKNTVLRNAKAQVDRIVEKGFNVYIKDGMRVQHDTRTGRFDNFDIFTCEYFVDEDEIYEIIFCNGVHDGAVREAMQTATYFVNKKIEEAYEKAIRNIGR